MSSETSKLKVKFLDSYDLTYNQFETMRKEYYQAENQVDKMEINNTETDMTAKSKTFDSYNRLKRQSEANNQSHKTNDNYAKLNIDEEKLKQVKNCIENAQSAQTRAAVRKTKGMVIKEMKIAKKYAKNAIAIITNLKSKWHKSKKHVEDVAAINYDYLHVLVLLAISYGHLSEAEEATRAMYKCFDIIENDIRIVDEEGANITAKAFRKHAQGLKKRLGVALPLNYNQSH